MDFTDWLKNATKKDGSPLSPASVEHYSNGLKTVSEDMLSAGVIKKRLEDMELFELDIAIALIMLDPVFKFKDNKGKRMYSNALKRYRCYKYLNTDLGIQETTEEIIVNKDATLSITEKETIIKARRGQGIYRDKLIKKYNNKCIITDISVPQVLIASHIKPWAVCNNYERTDENNGLLLSATYDRLFDSGLITFDNNGKLAVSSMVSTDNANKLSICNGMQYNINYNPLMDKYLDYHNNIIFIR